MNNLSVNIAEKENRSKNILSTIRNLPSVPVVMMEVNRLLNNSMTSARDLGKIIRKDQGLTTKILAIANSPLYGLPRRVSTIEFAIVVLGFEQIKNIVVALSIIQTFNDKSRDDWQRKKFWYHSVTTASIAKKIADDLGRSKVGGEIFTAGLLHDLGISVMHLYFNQEFKKIISLVETKESSYLKAEMDVLGITHQDIGLFLADKWNLPNTLSEIITFHHNPSAAPEVKELAAIVHLADFMTQKFSIGDYTWDETMELDGNVGEILGFANDILLQNFINSYEEIIEDHIEKII